MKITTKILAVIMTLVMAATFTSVAFATATDAEKQAGRVLFTVGEYKDGAVDVSVRLVDCVGLTSGTLNFGYDAKDITKITKKNGADVKAIGEVDNAFSAEFNNKINPVVFGFYFKNALWSSAEWAADENADEVVNGENFEAAVLTVTGKQGATVTVTGELKIGEDVIPVETSFDIPDVAIAHTHTWDEGTVTKEATCKDKGIKTFTCACGETKTEEIPALGHKTDGGKVTKAATCTEKGVKTTTCTVCGATKTEEIPALGHKWVNGKCSVCGATKTEPTTADKPSDKPTEKETQKPVKTDAGKDETTTEKTKKDSKKDDKTQAEKDKNTGDNGILAIVAGLVVLGGAAVVVTRKRKDDVQ